MAKRILIVGGVAGGASCAARLRRLDETAEIVLFERGEYISFANCGLPYYIGGVIPKREQLLVQDVKTMNAWFNLEIHTKAEVIAIQPEQKTVTVRYLRTGEERQERYDVLVLSPGASPIVPRLEGLEEARDRIFTIRNIADVDALKGFMDTTAPKTAVVVGGGFIGLEMAENLRHKGLDVHLVEAADQVMTALDPEMATLIAAELKKNGVKLSLGTAIQGFADAGKTVVLADGSRIATDLTVLAIGVRPESWLIKDAGLAVNERGAIVIDDQFRVAGAEDIYAIGDAVETTDRIFGEKTQIPLAGPANRMGRMVADIICGKDKHYKGSLGSSIVRVFKVQAASTGKNEKQLKQMGMDYRSITAEAGGDSKQLRHVEEGAAIPATTIQVQSNLVKLRKRGRMLVASYEAVRYQKLDLFSVTLRQIGAHIARAQLEDAVDVLKNGDGNGNAASVFTTAAQGKLTYDDLVDFWAKFDPYEMNALLVSGDVMVKLLKLSEFQNPLTGLNFQGTGKLTTPLGANLLRTSVLPAGTAIGLDKRFALEMVQGSDVTVEYDKLIDRQLERAAVTTISGFAKVFKDASRVLEVKK